MTTAPDAYPAASAPAPVGPVPGRTLGIVAFVLSFFVNLIALILGIVALVQSRRAGAKNGWAVAAIIISAISIVVGVIVLIVVIAAAANLVAQCGDLGPGVHDVNGVTLTCN